MAIPRQFPGLPVGNLWCVTLKQITTASCGDQGSHLPGEAIQLVRYCGAAGAAENPWLKADFTVENIERDNFYLFYPVIKRYAGDDASVRLAAPAAESKIPQAVKDDAILVILYPLQDMRMMADHYVGAGVDRLVPGGFLIRFRRV